MNGRKKLSETAETSKTAGPVHPPAHPSHRPLPAAGLLNLKYISFCLVFVRSWAVSCLELCPVVGCVL